MNIKSFWSLIRDTFKSWSEDKAPRLAAALSYYTIFSVAPLLVLVIAITGFILGNNGTIRSQLMGQIQSLVGQQGAQVVDTLITNTSKPRSGIIATIIGIVTLILGATGVFGQLQDSLNTIWEVTPDKSRGILGMLKDRFLTFAMVLGLCFLLLVSFVVSAALSVVNQYFTNLLGGIGIISQLVNYAISIAVITFIFAAIFKVLPDVQIKWRDVWMGALVTAILFLVGQALISLYLSSAASTSVYGAAGSLVVILLWVYYSAQILFMGAEFTQVYARRHGAEIQPSKNARALTETDRAQQGIARDRPAATRHARQAQPVGQHAQQVMIPVAGQPAIHPAGTSASEETPVIQTERVRYEPPNPNTVIPVVAVGALAGIYTIGRVLRKIISVF